MEATYHGILNLEKVGFYYCGNLLWYLFYNIGTWSQCNKMFFFLRANGPKKQVFVLGRSFQPRLIILGKAKSLN